MKISIIFFLLFTFVRFSYADELLGKIKNANGYNEILCKTIKSFDSTGPKIYRIEKCLFTNDLLFISHNNFLGISIFEINGKFIKRIEVNNLDFEVADTNLFVLESITVSSPKIAQDVYRREKYKIQKYDISSGKRLLSFGETKAEESYFNDSKIQRIKTIGNHLLVYGDKIREYDSDGNFIKTYPTYFWDDNGYFYDLERKEKDVYLKLYNDTGKLIMNFIVYSQTSEHTGVDFCDLEKVDGKVYVLEKWASKNLYKYKRYSIDGKIIEERETPYNLKGVKPGYYYDCNNLDYYLKITDKFVEIWKKI